MARNRAAKKKTASRKKATAGNGDPRVSKAAPPVPKATGEEGEDHAKARRREGGGGSQEDAPANSSGQDSTVITGETSTANSGDDVTPQSGKDGRHQAELGNEEEAEARQAIGNEKTESTEAEELAAVLEPVLLEVPMGVPEKDGYRPSRVDLRLNGAQREGMARIVAGMRRDKVALRKGTLVQNGVDAVRWFAEQGIKEEGKE